LGPRGAVSQLLRVAVAAAMRAQAGMEAAALAGACVL